MKAIVAKLLRSIRGGQSGGGGESEEAYAADGANLHVYVALVKIASSESTGSFQVRSGGSIPQNQGFRIGILVYIQDLVQSILIELCNKLRAKDHKFRQQVRTSLAEVMQVLGPSHLQFLISVLETALTKGYQLHICVYTISYMVFALKGALNGDVVAAVLPKVLHYVDMELFRDFAKEKKVKGITRKTPEASKVSSYPLLQILSSAAGKESVRDLVQPFSSPRATATGSVSLEKVQKMKQALTSILTGLTENPSMDKSDLLLISFGILNGKLVDDDNHLTKEFAFRDGLINQVI